jgi:hydrogenase-4 component E
MNAAALYDGAFVFILLLNLAALGSSRIDTAIKAVALQGALSGFLPAWFFLAGGEWHTLALSIGAVIIKGAIIPALLFRALREAEVRREASPILGFTSSVVIGTALTIACFAVANELGFAGTGVSRLHVPVALSTISAGSLLMLVRRKAITQIVGYLLMENGIFLLSLALPTDVPIPIEVGILLDLIVAVFVMGIAVFHINREFDSMAVDHLEELRES